MSQASEYLIDGIYDTQVDGEQGKAIIAGSQIYVLGKQAYDGGTSSIYKINPYFKNIPIDGGEVEIIKGIEKNEKKSMYPAEYAESFLKNGKPVTGQLNKLAHLQNVQYTRFNVGNEPNIISAMMCFSETTCDKQKSLTLTYNATETRVNSGQVSAADIYKVAAKELVGVYYLSDEGTGQTVGLRIKQNGEIEIERHAYWGSQDPVKALKKSELLAAVVKGINKIEPIRRANGVQNIYLIKSPGVQSRRSIVTGVATIQYEGDKKILEIVYKHNNGLYATAKFTEEKAVNPDFFNNDKALQDSLKKSALEQTAAMKEFFAKPKSQVIDVKIEEELLNSPERVNPNLFKNKSAGLDSLPDLSEAVKNAMLRSNLPGEPVRN